MSAPVGAMTHEAVAHHRVAGSALAFVGCLGLVHAAWFSWRDMPSYIEAPALLAMSVGFLVIAAWMVTLKPDGASDAR